MVSDDITRPTGDLDLYAPDPPQSMAPHDSDNLLLISSWTDLWALLCTSRLKNNKELYQTVRDLLMSLFERQAPFHLNTTDVVGKNKSNLSSPLFYIAHGTETSNFQQYYCS